MTVEAMTCPYCNATQPPRAGLALGQRVACARCGESFAVTHLPQAIQQEPAGWGTSASAPAPAAPWSMPPGKRRWSNRALGGLVLGVMLVMGGIGLTYALMTQDFRRKNDTSLPRKSRRSTTEELPPLEPTPPARLAGLGYLPTATNVLAGASVPELLA